MSMNTFQTCVGNGTIFCLFYFGSSQCIIPGSCPQNDNCDGRWLEQWSQQLNPQPPLDLWIESGSPWVLKFQAKCWAIGAFSWLIHFGKFCNHDMMIIASPEVKNHWCWVFHDIQDCFFPQFFLPLVTTLSGLHGTFLACSKCARFCLLPQHPFKFSIHGGFLTFS